MNAPIQILVAMMFVFGTAAQARVILVPEHAQTIQGGIDLAASGDTVRVAAGIYSGEGNTALTFDGKDLHLRGDGPELTILRGLGRTLDDLAAIEIVSPTHSEIVGFGIESFDLGFNAESGAVLVRRGQVEFRQCWFRRNASARGFGGRATDADIREDGDVRFIDCRFEDNQCSSIGIGEFRRLRDQVAVTRGDRAAFQDCVFVGSCGAGIVVDDGHVQVDSCFVIDNFGAGILVEKGELELTASTVAGNADVGIRLQRGRYSDSDARIVRIEDSILWGNRQAPLAATGAEGEVVTMNTSISEVPLVRGLDPIPYEEMNLAEAPRFVGQLSTDPAREARYNLLFPVSPALPENNPYGHRIGAGVPTIEFEDSYLLTVPNPYPTIQAAVDAARKSDTILVSCETVSGPGDQVQIWGERDLRVVGPIDGAIQTGNPWRAFFVVHPGASLRVSNLIFRGSKSLVEVSGGTVSIENCEASGFREVAVQGSAASRISISDSYFEGGQGVLRLEDSTGTLTRTECTGAVGAVLESVGPGSVLQATDLHIHDNSADDRRGGIMLEEGHHSFESMVFAHNSGESPQAAAIGVIESAEVDFRRCQFLSNSSEWALLRSVGSQLRFEECSFIGQMGLSPLTSASSTDIDIFDTTMAANAPSPTIRLGSESDLHVERSIIYQDCPYGESEIQIADDISRLSVTCSILDTTRVDDEAKVAIYTNVISEDPMFVNPGGCGHLAEPAEAYSLRRSSPGASANNSCGVRMGSQPVEGCEPDLPTGSTDGMRLAQNPISCFLRVQFSNVNSGTLALRVYSAAGTRVARRSAPVSEDGWISWNLADSGLPSGIYYLVAEGQNLRRRIRFTLLR